MFPVTDQAHGNSVLYIEDDPLNLKLMERIMTHRSQVKLLTTSDPRTGLRLAGDCRPGLILLDLHLPGLSGYEVFEGLRAREATRTIPVVAISGSVMPEQVKQAKSAGFDNFLPKPFTIDQIFALVDERLPARS